MKKSLLLILIVSILASIPFIYERTQVEMSNSTYEMTIPYTDIDKMMENGVSRDEVLSRLSSAGVESVGIEPVTFGELEHQAYVSQVKKNEIMRFFRGDLDQVPVEDGVYIEVFRDHPVFENLDEVFGENIVTLSNGEQTFYYIRYGNQSATLDMPLGYDMELVEELSQHDLGVVVRISNFSFEDESHFLFDYLRELRQYGNKILFSGVDVPGFLASAPGKTQYLEMFGDFLQENDYTIVLIENMNQDGLNTLIKKVDKQIVRLLSYEFGKGKEGNIANAEKAIRGMKERNIRHLYLNVLGTGEYYDGPQEVENGLSGVEKTVTDIQTRAPGSFVAGSAQPFQELEPSLLLRAIVLLGSTAFVGLIVSTILPKFTYIKMAAFALIAAAQLVTGHMLLLKLLALGIAIFAPVYAVLAVRDVKNPGHLLLQYAKAAGIALVGAWAVVGLLYGTDFIVKLDAFSGVKALAALPMLIGVVFLFSFKSVKSFLQLPVRYWHLIIMAIFGAVFLYYVTRTGNAGVALPYELEFRQWLENTLYARPRTSEFLVGFPMFFVGLYLSMKKKKYAPIFLLFGFIGFSSMVGTFTHLHTPLLISALRTVYSLVIGAGLGVILILVHNLIFDKIYPMIKSRW